MGVERFGLLNGKRGQLLMQLLQYRFGEPGTDIADRLIRLRAGVVAREQESAVHAGAFAFAEVSAQDNKVETVSDA